MQTGEQCKFDLEARTQEDLFCALKLSINRSTQHELNWQRKGKLSMHTNTMLNSLSIGRKFLLGPMAVAIMFFISCTSDGGSGFDALIASEDSTPLHEAVYHENDYVVRQLLNAGADPNAKINALGWEWDGTEMHGMTPLHIAVIDVTFHVDPSSITMVRRLLDAGADPNAKTAMGVTPLDIAKRRGSGAMTSLLRSYGGR